LILRGGSPMGFRYFKIDYFFAAAKSQSAIFNAKVKSKIVIND